MVFVRPGPGRRARTRRTTAGCAQLCLARLRQSCRRFPACGVVCRIATPRLSPRQFGDVPACTPDRCGIRRCRTGRSRPHPLRASGGAFPKEEGRLLREKPPAAIERHWGNRPGGWLGPWISQSPLTPDLLQKPGYHYLLDWCHDDQPVWMKTRHGRILSVPYPQELNDIPQIVARKREGPEFADMIVDAFDVMHEECTKRPLVMGIALHAYIVGWPHRFKHLTRA